MTAFKPMLACAPGPEGVTNFPVEVTPKIDGIRAVMLKGALVSRTLKPIPNVHVRAALESVLPDGADGELMYGDTFQSCTSAVMTRDGPASGFTYYAFDYVGPRGPGLPYLQRISELSRFLGEALSVRRAKAVRTTVHIVVLVPEEARDAKALDALESKALAAGFEGLIARLPNGRYKYGRSTPREGLLLKIKRFEDAEAEVTGAEELVHTDQTLGKGSKLLGALVVVRPDGVEFRIGTGFSAQQRKDLWGLRQTLYGKMVKYKFFRIGMADAPRFPTFIGFRDVLDM